VVSDSLAKPCRPVSCNDVESDWVSFPEIANSSSKIQVLRSELPSVRGYVKSIRSLSLPYLDS
jgi:hypothetical protein